MKKIIEILGSVVGVIIGIAFMLVSWAIGIVITLVFAAMAISIYTGLVDGGDSEPSFTIERRTFIKGCMEGAGDAPRGVAAIYCGCVIDVSKKHWSDKELYKQYKDMGEGRTSGELSEIINTCIRKSYN